MYLTAITHTTCISVSGHPIALASFENGYIPSTAISTRYAPIYALYHSAEQLDVKCEILHDISHRSIQFPARTDLQRNIRSTITGTCISATHDESITLLEEVLDMTLIYSVNYDRVVDTIRAEILPSRDTKLINIGPGNVLWRSISRALSSLSCKMVDWSPATRDRTSTSKSDPTPQNSTREPIAIVGMAVRFPGAQDANGLWNILENGLNTVSEVPKALLIPVYYAHRCGRYRSLLPDSMFPTTTSGHMAPNVH